MYSMLKSSLLLLLAVGLSNCDENTCPTFFDIYPCKCSPSSFGLRIFCDGDPIDLSIEGRNTVTIESVQNALRKLSGKKINFISLSSFSKSTTPSELFNGLNIQVVHLQGTKFEEMPAFIGSENTLQELTFMNALSEKAIPNFILNVSHLNKLKSLTLRDNYYVRKGQYNTISVSNDWFKNSPSSLEIVKLSSNQAYSFEDRVFSEILNLKEIDLSGNRIEKVHRSMFPDPAKNLFSINLGNNYIESLPEDIFSHMHVLQKVDISSNLIGVLDEQTWMPVWEQLDSLLFGTTSIRCDSTVFWTFGLSRPTYLDVYCDESYDEYHLRDLADIIDEKQKQGMQSNIN